MSNLRAARKAMNLTQQQVADYMGITQNTYSYWERGAVKVDSENLKKLATLFNCSVDYLLDINCKMHIYGRQKPPFLITRFYPGWLSIYTRLLPRRSRN